MGFIVNKLVEFGDLLEKVAEDKVASVNHPWITGIWCDGAVPCHRLVTWLTEENNSWANRSRSRWGFGVKSDDSWVGHPVEVAEAEIVG